MDKSIEAAARAATDWKNQHGTNIIYCWEVDGMISAAIAAYRDAEIADLRAKLEAAERDKEYWRFQYCLELVKAKNAEAAFEAAERDAGRYRWLRENWVEYHERAVPQPFDEQVRRRRDALDAAIDLARGGERG